MEQYSLTYDFGSGSLKAALVNAQHRIAASCNLAYSTIFPQKGWAVQRPDELWVCMQQATRQLMETTQALPSQVRGIAISHTGSNFIFLDKNGVPLCDCVLWMDGRAVVQAAQLNQALGEQRYTGKNVIAKLRWFMENEPELIARAEKMVDLQGYLFFLMTGTVAYEHTSAWTTRLYDPHHCRWDDAQIALCGIPRRLLPERIVRSEELVATLLPEAAALLGLQAGTPVFGGCCDHATAVLGAACVHPGDAHIYIGTSAWLAVTAEHYEDDLAIRSSPVPGQWYYYMESDSGGNSIDFLIRHFYQKELDQGLDVYSLIGEEASVSGAYRDVLFLPFLTGASAPINDVLMRASFLNLEAGTSRGQLARAVLDGLGFNLLWLKEFYQKKHGWHPRSLRGIGGGMMLPASVQTIADILGDPITTMRDPRFAGNIGLSVCVEAGLRGTADAYEILETTGSFDRVFYPNPDLRERYDRLFSIYKEAFAALSGIYQKLNERKETVQ